MKKLVTIIVLLNLTNVLGHYSNSKKGDFDLDRGYLQISDSLIVINPKSYNEIIVTYQADKSTPITFQDLSSTEIKLKSVGQEPSFLLSETPSLTNYSDAGNSQGYSYFRLRGIDQTRINVTLDGVPLNEPEDQGAYFSNYPDIFNSVSKIQIQRGVGTSKNGVASYGGSIQLFSPNLYDTSRSTIGCSFGSFNSLRAFGEYNSGIQKNKSVYIRASEIYSDGYKYNSSNNSQSVYISSGLNYDKSYWKLNFLLGHQQNQLAWIGVSDSLIEIDRKTNANKNEKDQFSQCLAQIQNYYLIDKFSSVQSSIYYTFLNGNYDFNLNNFLGFTSTNELFNYAFQSNLLGLFLNYNYDINNLNLTTGVHGNIYNRKHIGSEQSLGQLYFNIGYKNEASIFTKANYSLDWLTLFTDLQYRYSSFDYKGSIYIDKLQWFFFNPKLGLSVEIKPNSLLYYSIGSTGREPTRNDMFGGNDNLLSDSLGNTILKIKTPEYVLNQEFGFKYQSTKINLNFNFYYMDFKNEIVLDGKFGPNGLALINNVDHSFRSGFEVSIIYKINNCFSLINNSSFNYSRIKEQKEVFSPILTPPIIINQEVVYSFKGLTFALSTRYQDKSFINFSNTSIVKSYIVFNGRFTYNFSDYDFSVFLNNITNSHYFNNGYEDFDGIKKYFVQAPTNVYVSIHYRL